MNPSSWVPASAGALVTGVLALFAGALLLPQSGGDTAATLEVVDDHGGRWLAMGLMFFAAGVGLLLGLPACLMLFRSGARVVGGAGIAVMAVAAAATTGYAMLVVFFRALVLAEAVRPNAFERVLDDPGLQGFLLAWVACFHVGELLLAVAVLRSGTVARWIPGALVAHVALWPLSALLPEWVGSYAVVLVVVGFCGMAFAAVEEVERRTRVERATPTRERPRAF